MGDEALAYFPSQINNSKDTCIYTMILINDIHNIQKSTAIKNFLIKQSQQRTLIAFPCSLGGGHLKKQKDEIK